MSAGLIRQQREILQEYQDLVEELELRGQTLKPPLMTLLGALKKAYAVLQDEWTRDAAETAAFLIDRSIIKTQDFDSLYTRRASLLARRTEEMGRHLNR